MEIWQACEPYIKVTPLSGELVRVVESQEQIATTRLVDNLDEQGVLEQLLEQNKPAPRADTQHLHYLLATPFRYPPLLNGSRFSTRFQPSLFYASKSITTALAETAYYRFVFWNGMSIPPSSGKLQTQHTAFTADYHTERGLQLHKAPFSDYQTKLCDPANYQVSQQLGEKMRKEKIEAFEYASARDNQQGINIALFAPSALTSTQPTNQQPWLCETTAQQVSFASHTSREIIHYPIEQFLVEGELPQPSV